MRKEEKTIMKKKTIVLTAFVIVFLAASAAAEAPSKIEKYDETVKLSKEGTVIAVSAACVSDSQGFIYLPARGKLALKEISVQGAALLNAKGEDGKLGDLACYKLKIDKPESAVEVKIVWDAKDAVQKKNAKLGTTYPGGVTNFSRSFVNSTSGDIKKYSLTLLVPEGTELYSMEKPKDFEKLQLSSKNGDKVVAVKAAALKAGGSSDFSVNVYSRPGSGAIIVWAVVMAASAFVMVKRRGVMKRKSKP